MSTLLSDDPNGTVETGLPSGEVRAGVVKIGATTVDVILVRVDDPVAGKIWLVSKDTVARDPRTLRPNGRRDADGSRTNRACCSDQSAPVGYVTGAMAWVATLDPDLVVTGSLLEFLSSAPRRIWCRLRKLSFNTIWKTPLGMPLRCIVAILVHGLFVYLLDPPLLYRVYYARFLARPPGGVFRGGS